MGVCFEREWGGCLVLLFFWVRCGFFFFFFFQLLFPEKDIPLLLFGMDCKS